MLVDYTFKCPYQSTTANQIGVPCTGRGSILSSLVAHVSFLLSLQVLQLPSDSSVFVKGYKCDIFVLHLIVKACS